MGPPTELSLFSGAGLGSLATQQLLGFRTVAYVERDPFCQRLLARRIADGVLDDAPIWDDVRTFDGRPWRESVDLLTAGFPCPAHSTASRGRVRQRDLFAEVLRIADEVEPTWLLLENVLAKAFPQEWRSHLASIDAAALGAASRRRRVWLVAHAHNARQRALAVHAQVASLSAPRATDPWREGPSRVLGMDLRRPHRVDRLRALGNGWVPRVAHEAWHRLTEREPPA